MAKRKNNEATPDQAVSGSEPAPAASTPEAKPAPLPQLDLLKVEAPPVAPVATAKARAAKPQNEKIETAKAAVEAPKAPTLEKAAASATVSSSSGPALSARTKRFALLAASVALAAGLGGLAGAMTVGVLMPTRTTDAPAAEERLAIQKAIAHLAAEVALLKTNIEASNKLASAQFGKLGERFDRNERAQAEPAQRLAKITEILDRLERRTASSTVPETTGSVVPQRAAAAPAPEIKDQSKPVVDGWSIRDARNGLVTVQSRSGIYEVVPGADLPGLGKVETIKRQDGHWIVVTQKGLITARAMPPRPRGYYLDDF